MKPKLTVELSQDDIKALLREWAAREYPRHSATIIDIRVTTYGDCMDRPLGQNVSATVQLVPLGEGRE